TAVPVRRRSAAGNPPPPTPPPRPPGAGGLGPGPPPPPSPPGAGGPGAPAPAPPRPPARGPPPTGATKGAVTCAGPAARVQGTAEGAPFSRSELDTLLDLAEAGLSEIFALQEEFVAEPPPPRPSTKR